VSVALLGFVAGSDAMCAKNMGTSYIRRVINPIWWFRTVRRFTSR
jgi:hypothetical protein